MLSKVPMVVILTRAVMKLSPDVGERCKVSYSDHRIAAYSRFRDRLGHIPVLHYLPRLKPENIDDREPSRLRLDDLVHVQDHIVAIDEHALYFAVRLGRRRFQLVHELAKALDS